MRLRRIRAVARKEAWHVIRDPFTLLLALGLPLMLVIIFGYAIDFDVKDVGLAIDDRDRTYASRELVRIFENTGSFKAAPVESSQDPNRLLGSERYRAILIIKRGFERDIQKNQASVQLLLDGADNTVAGPVLSYLDGILAAAAARLSSGRLRSAIRLKTRFLFNPELNTPTFIIPGLAVVVVAIVSILLTALTMAREYENGSMELLLSTPLTPLDLIIGKVLPYILVGIGAIALVYLAARLGFHVPFRGSHILFGLGALLFLSAYLAQGILISIMARSQQVAMQFAMISGMLPSLLLSGFIFPIENMPVGFQWLTMVLPARWFMTISRGVFLKGSGIMELGVAFIALGLINVLLVMAATRKFKKDLET